jgi:shikimate dehydrogenase
VGRLVLLGQPVAHSLSPAFQNAALAAAGLPARYEALAVDPADLSVVLDRLVRERAAGNVTVPHKEAAAERCDLRTPLAIRVGAVNTFWVDAAGALVGDNTDVGGFLAAARALLGDRPPARVALAGAGGSARAVLAAAAEWPGCEVRLLARTRARAEGLAGSTDAPVVVCASAEALLDGAQLVVNATPLGLHDADAHPLPVECLPARAAVLDLVYRPGETRWVRACRAAGHAASDGLPMLVEQGALAFERWFGRVPDREAMWAAVGGRPAGRA